MKQTKTKLLCLLLAMPMLLSSLTACGKDKAKDSNLIKLGDYELLYKGACIMEDSDGNDAIVLTLDFTNNGKENASYLWSVKGYVWMNEVNNNIFDATYEDIVAYFGVEGQFVKEEYSDHMKANYRYYKWISNEDDSHFLYVNFREKTPGVYTVSGFNTSGFSGEEAIAKYLDTVKAEAAEANKAASANAEMKDFSVEIAQFAKDDVKVKIMTKIPVSGWSFDDGKRCLVENDDPTAFGSGAIQFEVRAKVEDFDYYKDSFENYQDIEDRVIGGITFHGRTYKYIGYEWIQYIAQLDDSRALSVGLRNLDCVPGTMPDIILSNMSFR